MTVSNASGIALTCLVIFAAAPAATMCAAAEATHATRAATSDRSARAAHPWPDGMTVAVTLTFDLDAETLWWEDTGTMTGLPGPLSQGRYGPRVGLPKILDLLSRHELRATFYIPSWVASTYPQAVRSIVAGGHEVAAHGVRHESPSKLSPEEETRRLRESISVLSELAGERPVGYRAPSWSLSEESLGLVASEGFLYSSNLMDSDLPYVHTDPAGLVELPVSWVLDDAPHFWFDEDSWDRPVVSASHVEAIWKEEFEAVYRMGGYFDLTMHPQIIGRPARIRMLDRLIGWLRGFDGVWFATCREVAERIREEGNGD